MNEYLRANAEVKYLLAIDIETTGQTPRTGTMIEMAAALVSLRDKSVVATRYYYFGLEEVQWCSRTLLEFWNNQEMGKDGKTPLELLRERVEADEEKVWTRRDAALDFVTWARAAFADANGAVLVITDTVGFDAAFVSDLLAEHQNAKEWPIGESMPYSINYLFGSYEPVRDISSFYLGAGGTLKKWKTTELLKKRFHAQIVMAGGTPDGEPAEWATRYPHDHNPLNDARKIGMFAAFYLTMEPSAGDKRDNNAAQADAVAEKRSKTTSDS